MKTNQLSFLVCFVLCYALNIAKADNDAFFDDKGGEPEDGNRMGVGLQRDEELFQVAYRFIRQLAETRKSLSALKNVLGYLDEDLKQKSELLEERYVKGKDLWNVLKEAVRSEEMKEGKTKEMTKRRCRVNLGGHCPTENAVSLANQMHFLSSALSPGKRRRRNAVDAANVRSDSRVENINIERP